MKFKELSIDLENLVSTETSSNLRKRKMTLSFSEGGRCSKEETLKFVRMVLSYIRNMWRK